jgi:chromate reductase
MITNRARLLGVSGSLRRESSNTAILRSLAEALAERADFDIFPLNDVPLYDQDLDTDIPPAGVQALRDAIGSADGLVIASPEYNYGIPGVLKNALDWASRPYGRSSLIDKPVLIVTASPAFTGGVRAQHQLIETLHGTASRVVVRPQTVIGAVHEKIQDGRLADAATLDFLVQAADHLLRDIGVCETLRAAA